MIKASIIPNPSSFFSLHRPLAVEMAPEVSGGMRGRGGDYCGRGGVQTTSFKLFTIKILEI